jgi:hypothetical protein
MIHSPTTNVALNGIYGMVTALFANRFQLIWVNYRDRSFMVIAFRS